MWRALGAADDRLLAGVCACWWRARRNCRISGRPFVGPGIETRSHKYLVAMNFRRYGSSSCACDPGVLSGVGAV